MSIANMAASVRDGVPWRTCATCHALNTIPPAEADGLRVLLRSNKRYDEIRDMIAADEDTPLKIPADALARHARGDCEAHEVLRPRRKRRDA